MCNRCTLFWPCHCSCLPCQNHHNSRPPDPYLPSHKFWLLFAGLWGANNLSLVVQCDEQANMGHISKRQCLSQPTITLTADCRPQYGQIYRASLGPSQPAWPVPVQPSASVLPDHIAALAALQSMYPGFPLAALASLSQQYQQPVLMQPLAQHPYIQSAQGHISNSAWPTGMSQGTLRTEMAQIKALGDRHGRKIVHDTPGDTGSPLAHSHDSSASANTIKVTPFWLIPQGVNESISCA